MYPQKVSIIDETTDRIIEMIRRGDYAPGDRLPGERKLAAELKVSRTSVREAIQRLEAMGLVTSRHGQGTFVKEPGSEAIQAAILSHLLPSKKKIREVFELRKIIEVEAAGQAALHIEANEIELMRKWLENVETNIAREDLQSVIIADVEFHRQILIATDNEILVNVMDSIVDLLRDTRRDSVNLPELLPVMTKDHRAILAAIEAGDSQAARQAMQEHLSIVFSQIETSWKEKDQ
jgi:GntR family transcriptional regulator, transcriptional repressor for pyruvate dehydrogenase complex